MTLASRIASALVNAELYARVVGQRTAGMDREMKIAREIQHQLMPDEVPSMPPLQWPSSSSRSRSWGRSLRLDHIRRRTPGDRRRRCRRQRRARRAVRRAVERHHPHARGTKVSAGPDARTREQDAVSAADRKPVRRADLCHLRPEDAKDHAGELRTCRIRCSCAPVSRRFSISAEFRWDLFPDSKYEETTLQLQTGDVLVFYSDGSRRNAQ